jgi:hypothetical protein
MILTMIRNTELFDAFSDPGFFYSGSGVVDEKWKIHNNTMANGNLVMMGGGGQTYPVTWILLCSQLLHFFVI